ncbi:nSTAND1 domain-containing NTPase [Crossiella cryophila]|uniref:WD40 repeat protein n=1 Tax=Crossiella cryophila TaxID=43355 RepID=A0A7W7FV24_9PSEU|nr:hypothetical protein [Crossiella cryophila]MBB4678832.1 WD40 repeat protein [Crossiella cryophila]
MPRAEKPLEANGSPLVEFALALRRLRAAAGSPSYRALAGTAHYSATTLADAASGAKLPSLAVTLAYVRACGGTPADWEPRWRRLTAQLAGPPPEPETEATAPYVGLAAFGVADADRFFGRDRLITDLCARLADHRLLAVFGASGAGKSSLLRAGLLPRLSARPILFTPGADPWEECALALATPLGLSPGSIRDELRTDPRALYRLTRQVAGEGEVVLIVDQFEELFTSGLEESERAGFIATLCATAESERSQCRVILGIRADFYPHCAGTPQLADLLRDNVFTVGPMTPEELRRAITGPARHAGCAVESALLTHLVATTGPGALPLLSHALLETWRRRRGNTLTLAGFESTGGLDHALANTAEAIFTTLTEPQRQATRQLFRRLTAPGEGTEDTKRRIPHTELDGEAATLATVVEHFATARLLVTDEHGLEITHEALLQAWPRLHTWLTEDREGLRLHRALSEAATEWHRLARDPSTLYRGTRLSLARSWTTRENPLLSTREQDFLTASQSAEHADQRRTRRHTRQLRLLAAALAVLLIAATGIASVAYDQERLATSRQLTAEAQLRLNSDTGQAIRLALAAHDAAETEQSRGLLLKLANTPPEHARLNLRQTRRIAFSPTGDQVLTDNVRWDTASRRMIEDNDPELLVLDYFPSGGDLLVRRGSWVSRWNPVIRKSAGLDRPWQYQTEGIALAADGRQVWLHTPGGAPIRNDLDTGRDVSTLPVRSKDLLLSPDRTRLATITENGELALWDALTSAPIQHALPDLGPVSTVAFHRDGRYLATATRDGTVRIHQVHTGELIAELPGSPGFPRGIAFAAQPHTVAVIANDGRLTLRSPYRPTGLAIGGQHDNFERVTFDPVGRMLAASSATGVSLWDRTRLPLYANNNLDWQWPPVFERTGQSLRARTRTDQLTWQLGRLDPPTSTPLLGTASPLRLGPGQVLSPDGTLVAEVAVPASASATTVRRVADQTLVATGLPATSADSVGFTPDNRYLVLTRTNTPPQVHDLLTGETRHLDALRASSPTFSIGGHHLAITTTDRTIVVWDLRTGTRTAEIPAPPKLDYRFALSPDGQKLAMPSGNRTVDLWDLPTGDNLAALDSDQPEVRALSWHPDGSTLTITGSDTTITLWRISVPNAITALCESLDRDFRDPDQPSPAICTR